MSGGRSSQRKGAEDEGVQAGFVDDGGMLLSAHGVTNRYPISLPLVTMRLNDWMLLYEAKQQNVEKC